MAIALIGNVNDDGYLKTKDSDGHDIEAKTIIEMVADEMENDIEYVEEILEMVL